MSVERLPSKEEREFVARVVKILDLGYDLAPGQAAELAKEIAGLLNWRTALGHHSGHIVLRDGVSLETRWNRATDVAELHCMEDALLLAKPETQVRLDPEMNRITATARLAFATLKPEE